MVERLTIDHLGNRGDGVALADMGPLYVPYALPGETVEVDNWPGHPDRRHLLRVEAPSLERVAPICPHSACAGAARCSTATPRPTVRGSAKPWWRSCAKPGLRRRSAS